MQREIHVSTKEDFAVDLGEEILTEAAHSLFSRRVRLEREIEAFSQAAAKVRKQMHKTLQVAETMHRVVIEPEKLYTALGLDPKDLLRAETPNKPVDLPKVRFRFTLKGRYVALAKALYSELAAETEKYNHGEPYRDPKTHLMKRTAHYEDLLEWHKELTGRIDEQNRNLPSYSLQLAKSLNVDLCEKEKLMKACAWEPDGCDLDQKLSFKGIPFSCTGLVQMPVLPPVREIKTRLHSFLKEIYDRHSAKIHQLLLQKGPVSYTPGPTTR